METASEKEHYKMRKIVLQMACINIALEIETDLKGQGAIRQQTKQKLASTSRLLEHEFAKTINTLYDVNEDTFTKIQKSIEYLVEDVVKKETKDLVKVCPD